MANRFALIGPQGIGKTRAATRIAAALGIANVIDDWFPENEFPENTLAVTNFDLPRIDGWEDVVVIQVSSSAGIQALIRAFERAAAQKEPDCGCGHGPIRKPYEKEFTRRDCASSNPLKLNDWLYSDPLPAAESRHLRQQAREWLASLPAAKASRFSWLRLAVRADALPAKSRPSAWTWLRLKARAFRLELQSVLRTSLARISRP